MQKLSIGIDSWVIQDGNYEDFAIGETRNFALEFGGYKLAPCQAGDKSAQLADTCVYRVRAQVVFVGPKVWIIDFGILAFMESEPPIYAEVGVWVEGDGFIGIDPFFYKEYLHKLPNIPKLIYNWKVEGILLDDTPWLKSVNESGGITLSRDLTREAWRKVECMNAWEDDNGRASYILQCQLCDV